MVKSPWSLLFQTFMRAVLWERNVPLLLLDFPEQLRTSARLERSCRILQELPRNPVEGRNITCFLDSTDAKSVFDGSFTQFHCLQLMSFCTRPALWNWRRLCSVARTLRKAQLWADCEAEPETFQTFPNQKNLTCQHLHPMPAQWKVLSWKKTLIPTRSEKVRVGHLCTTWRTVSICGLPNRV